MKTYKPRRIAFKEIVSVGDWQVKTYTISKFESFTARKTYDAAVEKLPEWLTLHNSFDPSHDRIAFLIVHQGTEGVFSLIHWWVGKNMLHGHIFLSLYETPRQFKRISGDGLSPCVWELEVINHERLSWMAYTLKKPGQPDFDSYLNDHYYGEV